MDNVNSTDTKNIDLLKSWGYSTIERCLIVGPLPPPIGGVSIHISRLLPLLDNASITYKVHDSTNKIKGYNFWGLFCKVVFNNFDQIHIHSLSEQILYSVFIARIFFPFKIILYAHNPVFFEDKSTLFNKILTKLLNKVAQINAVSDVAKETIIKQRPHLESKIFVKSSFLPPDLSKLHDIKKSYPKSLKLFLTQHNPIIILNAYRFHFKDGVDVYGFDLSIELLIRLSKSFPNIGMILALGKRNHSSDYIEQLIMLLKENDLQSNFYILDEFKHIWALFDDCDLMIRPTLYEGYGISVSEAIIMGTAVLASDLPNRQTECFLFKNRNIDDFEKVSLEILTKLT